MRIPRPLVGALAALGVTFAVPSALFAQEPATTASTTPAPPTTTTATTPTTTTPAPGYTARATLTTHQRQVSRFTSRTVGKKASSGTSVTIRDFEFDPADVSISVGDAVTWTNDGPSTHTAT